MVGLMIGSAQFGLNYGIAHGYKQVPRREVLDIVKCANDNGINWIDTASVYGNAESVLGRCKRINRFNIVTKIHLGYGKEDPFIIEERIRKSLCDLKIKKLYGALVHDPNDLITAGRREEVFGRMCEVKNAGLANKIGVSVHSPEQAYDIINRFDIDLIQIPCNILDQRFVMSGMIDYMNKKNIEIHVRSIFLQGLLLMDPSRLDPYFNDVVERLLELKKFADDHGVDVSALAIEYIKSVDGIDKIVIGIDNTMQLKQNIANYLSNFKTGEDFSKYHMTDERFILPSNWRLKCAE